MQWIHNFHNSLNGMWVQAICRENLGKGKKTRFMKRSPRFYFALLFAKATAKVMKLIGRKGTSMPGSWAIILCPDFLGRMPRPKYIIGITGTNGKTTVSNMVEDVLTQCGYEFTCNRSGSNVATGVASSLIANSTLFGKPKKDLAVFELDERSAPRILPFIKPDLLLCTNIFRDSYKRNAHVEFILDILNTYIPDSTKLVLNADDLLCSSLKPSNRRVFFSIDPLPNDVEEAPNLVQDVRVCPHCGATLEWDLRRYHHIGRAHCPQCGFTSPEARYHVSAIDENARRMTVEGPDGPRQFALPNTSPINVYNALSAVALLAEFGLAKDRIAQCMDQLTIVESRFSKVELKGRGLVLHLAKGQNPIACSQACANVQQAPGKKTVLLLLDDAHDAAHSVENTAWLYDTDFEFLNQPAILQVAVAGPRHWDVAVRLLMAGLPQEKLIHWEDPHQAAAALEVEAPDTVFVLYDLYSVDLAKEVKGKLLQRMALLPPKEPQPGKEAAGHEN